MLAASLFGGAASAASKRASHLASLTVNASASGVIAILTHRNAKYRDVEGTFWERRGPTVLTVASVPLVSADPLRHVLQDRGAWGASSAMYREGCPHGDVRCLSAVGWMFLLFTYAGFACMIFCSLWSADALGKLSREWRRRTRGDGDGAV